MIKVLSTKQVPLRKPFIKVGMKIVYLGSNFSRGDSGRWILNGDFAKVIEFHDAGTTACLLEDEEEQFWSYPCNWATVEFTDGTKIAIQADGNGKIWKHK